MAHTIRKPREQVETSMDIIMANTYEFIIITEHGIAQEMVAIGADILIAILMMAPVIPRTTDGTQLRKSRL